MSATDTVKLRDQALIAALPHVPFDGWTVAALRRGAKDAGLDPDETAKAFSGAADMVAHFSELSDRRMLAALDDMDRAAMRTPQRVAAAIRGRLEQAEPHREAVQRAVSFLALPLNVPLGAKLLYRTVDAIWYAAGDTATDWNWYSKRGLLAGVFSATVLYWLNDRSEGCADTWDFLDRRLRDVAALGKATGGLMEKLKGFPRPYRAYRPGRR